MNCIYKKYCKNQFPSYPDCELSCYKHIKFNKIWEQLKFEDYEQLFNTELYNAKIYDIGKAFKEDIKLTLITQDNADILMRLAMKRSAAIITKFLIKDESKLKGANVRFSDISDCMFGSNKEYNYNNLATANLLILYDYPSLTNNTSKSLVEEFLISRQNNKLYTIVLANDTSNSKPELEKLLKRIDNCFLNINHMWVTPIVNM